MNARAALARFLVVLGIAAGASGAGAVTGHRPQMTLPDAIEIAQREVPDGLLIDSRVTEHAYTVAVVKQGLVHAVRIDLQSGRVVEIARRRVHPQEWKRLAGVEGAPVGLLKAVAIAEDTFPGSQFLSVAVKIRRGHVRWAVSVEDEGLGIVDVDPQEGRLLRIALRMPPERTHRSW